MLSAGMILLPASLLSLWFVRNVAVTGHATGERGSSVFSIPDVADASGSALARSFAVGLPKGAGLGLTVAVGAFCIAAAVRCSRSRPFAVFVLAYLGVILASGSLTAVDVIDLRLISPVFVPLIAALLLFGDDLGMRATTRRHATLVLSLVISALLLGTAYASARDVGSHLANYPLDVEDRERDAAEYRLFADVIPRDAPLYSNGPEHLYLISGRVVRQAPRKHFRHSKERTNDLERWLSALESEEAYLVWSLGPLQPDYLYEPEELGRCARLDPVFAGKRFEVYGASAYPQNSSEGLSRMSLATSQPV